jgi:hypothetical protein
MWYHYLLLLIALYLIGTSIYNVVMAGNQAGWVINGISAAIGGGFLMWASSGLSAPPAPVLGGRRR